MTRSEIIQHNDLVRTTLRGITVMFTPELMELPPRLRGRLLYQVTQYNSFHKDSDHSEGLLVFAGYAVIWRIDVFAGVPSLTLSTSYEEVVSLELL